MIRYCGSRGIIPLVQEHEGRTGPRLIACLRNMIVNGLYYFARISAGVAE